MNFDVKGYCERIAKACPERFQWHGSGPCWSGGASWWLKPMTGNPRVTLSSDVRNLDSFWAFIGPLADELGIGTVDVWDRRCEGPGGHIERMYDCLLEATFAAVCEKLETAKP